MSYCKACGTNRAKILTKIKALRRKKPIGTIWIPHGLSPIEAASWRLHKEFYREVKITNPQDLAQWGPSWAFTFSWSEDHYTYVAYNTPYWISQVTGDTCRAHKNFIEARP